jgi:hypothetical protein
MSVTELLPELQGLSRGENLYIMQYLLSQLATEEPDLLRSGLSYSAWSPYDAFEAADTMQSFLEAAKTNHARE